MKSRVNWALIGLLLSVMLQTVAALLVKLAALETREFTLVSVLANVYFLAMLGCLALQAVAWQVALRKYPLSFAYFITSILPVNILLISHFFFGEAITNGNVAGCLIIVLGLIVLTRETRAEPRV